MWQTIWIKNFYTPLTTPPKKKISCLEFPVHNLNFPLSPCVLHSNPSAHTVNMKYIMQLDTVPTARASIQQHLLRSEHTSSVLVYEYFQCHDLRALWKCWFWPDNPPHMTPHSGYEIMWHNLWALTGYSFLKFRKLMFTYAKQTQTCLWHKTTKWCAVYNSTERLRTP